MSRDPPPPTSATATATAKVCTNCYSDDPWILHNVKHQGLFKKLCTFCVLKLHAPSFCPSCFSLHDPNSLTPIPSSFSGGAKTLTCFKCSSLSHSTCVPPNVPKSPYLCPPCSNPSFKFFDIRKSPAKNHQSQANGGDASKVPETEKKVLDERSAKVLLAAARIAAISMNKAAATARIEADRRVRDSALAKKRAREAIDHVMALSARFAGNKRRETQVAEVPTPAPAPTPTKGSNAGLVKLENNAVAKANNVAPPPPATGAVQLGEKSNGNGNQLKAEH